MKHKIPDPNPDPVFPQSRRGNVAFPGITKAASDLEISRGHLSAVLYGERPSRRTLRRWGAWLKLNPEYARLQTRQPGVREAAQHR